MNLIVLRILVVEDMPELRETLAILLEEPGRFVATCGSAEEALSEFAKEPFDVVFADINLPRMSGLDLAPRLRALRPEIWIVLSSGAAAVLPSGDAAPRTRFLGKPFSMQALLAVMTEIEDPACARS